VVFGPPVHRLMLAALGVERHVADGIDRQLTSGVGFGLKDEQLDRVADVLELAATPRAQLLGPQRLPAASRVATVMRISPL
jgi:hypothetical protein